MVQHQQQNDPPRSLYSYWCHFAFWCAILSALAVLSRTEDMSLAPSDVVSASLLLFYITQEYIQTNQTEVPSTNLRACKKNSPACWTAFAFLYIGLHRAFAVRQVRTKTNFVYSRERVRICIDQAFSLKFWDFIFNVGIVQNLFRNVWNVAYIKVLN